MASVHLGNPAPVTSYGPGAGTPAIEATTTSHGVNIAPVLRPADRMKRGGRRSARQTLRALEARLTSDEVQALASAVERATATTTLPPSDSKAALVDRITGGRRFSSRERVELETWALLDYFQYRRHLLDGALTAPQVARLLGTTRQTPHDRVRKGSMLAVLDRGALRFPAWQFDPEGPDGVVRGLPAVLKALDLPALAKVGWLTWPNADLGNVSPLVALKNGESERVLVEARAVGAH